MFRRSLKLIESIFLWSKAPLAVIRLTNIRPRFTSRVDAPQNSRTELTGGCLGMPSRGNVGPTICTTGKAMSEMYLL